MNEAETRAEKIDPALKAAGWGVVEGSRIRRHRWKKFRKNAIVLILATSDHSKTSSTLGC